MIRVFICWTSEKIHTVAHGSVYWSEWLQSIWQEPVTLRFFDIYPCIKVSALIHYRGSLALQKKTWQVLVSQGLLSVIKLLEGQEDGRKLTRTNSTDVTFLPLFYFLFLLSLFHYHFYVLSTITVYFNLNYEIIHLIMGEHETLGGPWNVFSFL